MNTNEDNPIVVFGGSGHAKVVVSSLKQSGRRVLAVHDDDAAKWGGQVLGVQVLDPATPFTPDATTVIAIGDNAARERVARRLAGRKWATVIHPSAQVDPSAQVGPGTVIFAGAVVQAGAKLGEHVIVNTGATVDHDCIIDDFASIGPGAHVAGGVRVGRGTFLGIGSAVVQNVRIGDWTTVGAGGAVTRDLPDRVVAVGVPAKPRGPAMPSVSNSEPRPPAVRNAGKDNEDPQRKVRRFAPWPFFEQDEIEAVLAVLKSGNVNYWTGDEGHLFESEFAAFTGCDHAIALANGTLALELALHALDIGPGEEVIVPSRTFIASASCVVARGAVPVIADVDPVSQNITVETARAVLSPKTKAMIVVHLAGWPCDMDPLLDLARQHRLKVIEDCAQALGATYHGRQVGGLGDVAAFSFCQDKIITTGGEGGMLTTNDEAVWSRAWSFKDHGKSWEAVHRREHNEIFKWLHESFGSNYRLTEMQAAIGRIALRKLPLWIEQRQRNARILAESFSEIPALRLTVPPSVIGHSYYKYYTFVRPEHLAAGWNRDRIVRRLQEMGIPCGSGSCSEIYREEAFRRASLGPSERLPVAQKLGETSLMFLVHPTLSHDALRATCEAVEQVFAAASEWKSTQPLSDEAAILIQ